jgi:hypothetical protein
VSGRQRFPSIPRSARSRNGAAALATGTAAAGGQLDVVVWPHTTSDRDEVDNEIFDSLADLLTQLSDNNAIGDFSLGTRDETLESKIDNLDSIDSNCDTGSWFYDFQQNVTSGADVHVAVTDQSNFASASGECWGSNDYGHAFVGTAGGYDDTLEYTHRYKNLAKQEVGHVIINEDRIPSSANHPEHALGEVRPDNKSTPLVTFYEESPDNNPCASLGESASNGNCNDAYSWYGSHTNQITQCTIDAVKTTYDNDGY